MTKVVVFEFDGATWSVIEPLLKAGELPNLSHLIATGAHGVLRSISPMNSPALWTSIYTGKTRDKHGVYGFEATSNTVRVKRLWDIAHDADLTCGLFGSLVTWPPTASCSFQIPDIIMARGPETVPPEYSHLQDMYWNRRQHRLAYLSDFASMWRMGVRLRRLLRIGGERLVTAATRRSQLDVTWRQKLWWEGIRADVFLKLYRRYQPDLATFHYHAADTVQHGYWHYYSPQAFGVSSSEVQRYRQVIPTAYREADRIIGDLRRTLDPNTTLLVVSDHGASAETDAAQLFEARLEEWTAILGLRDIAIPMDITGAHCLYFLDRSYTAPTQRLLEEARDKRNGHKLFVGFVQRDGHLMFFPTREPIGDTVIIPNHGEYPFDQLCRRAVTRHSAEHHPEGIFIVAGPSIRRGIQLGAGSILDVAPNLLALLGLPIARDMDGRLWDKMFRPGHSFDFVETYETQEAQEVSTENLSSEDVDLLYERLRDLGYV